MEEKINTEDIAQKYNEMDVIWNENDKWHIKTKETINSFIQESKSLIVNPESINILNAGSAGHNYGLDEKYMTHVDIAKDKISHLNNFIVADIQKLPLHSDQFDLIICVGSVINYCDPLLAIKELVRVLKNKGHLILEFENSYTLELLGKSNFNKKATFVESFYNGSPEKIWYFSEAYIREIVKLSGMKVLSFKRWHVISPLIYRISKNESFAAKFSKIDKICTKIPFLRKFSSNTILLLLKEK